MSFEQRIKSWVLIDNEIKQYNEKLKTLRANKNQITEEINTYVNNNNMKHAVVKLSDGKLKFQNVKVTQPLTLTFIKKCLEDCIQSESQVVEVMNYIKSQRDIKYVEDIKRFYN